MAIITSILNGGTNNHPTTSEEANYFATDFIGDGVVGAASNTSNFAPMTGAFACNEQGTPDMTVAVTAGAAYVTATPAGQSSQVLRASMASNDSVTISANSTGSTKYDWIYLQVDATAANNPNLAGDDVASLVVSRSTSNTSDDGTPPTYGIGLAVVTVANGASSITNGNIRDIRTQSALSVSTGSSSGWVEWNKTFEYVSNDGNKQYTYKVSGEDTTGTTAKGMKIKLPRITAANTHSADLYASSSQYAKKTSPSGITFTDDFTCGAWIKLRSYGTDRDIVSRYDGSNGFIFLAKGTGEIQILGGNAGSLHYHRTHQSLPLLKWVHVAATLNMSGDVVAIYIDGVSVPVDNLGSTPTSLVQAGDLTVGGRSGGSNFFDGEIKHAFVADKIMSAAEVKEAMASDDLTAASFSADLVAYYKLNNDWTDSSSNSNDMTAVNSAGFTTDSPFSSTEYGVITSQSFSTDTTYTIFTGSYNAPDEDITAPSYSTEHAPYGMDVGKDKWRLSTLHRSYNATTSNANYGSYMSGGFALTVPIGAWTVGWQAGRVVVGTTPTGFAVSDTSLIGVAEDAATLDSALASFMVSGSGLITGAIHLQKSASLTAIATYTMYTKGATTSSIIDGERGIKEIYAECAYI